MNYYEKKRYFAESISHYNQYMDKKAAFEYIVYLMICWYKDKSLENPDGYKESFSKLTVLKLLFFVAAVKNFNQKDLLDIFDNFVALPHGPVESDIYTAINSSHLLNDNCLTYYNITSAGIIEKDNVDIDALKERLDEGVVASIEDSVSTLQRNNSKMIMYSAFELVDLSHRWKCWIDNYRAAVSLGLKAMYMSKESIRVSDQYFSL